MALTLALAGDTMLGRGVAERLDANPRAELLAPALVDIAGDADLFLLNLECCISERGAPIDMPGKPFFFRAPPVAARRLAEMGVDGVTLANNHALDFGPDALADTLEQLAAAGIATAGAGPDWSAARAGMTLATGGGERVRVIAVSDHPREYAATPTRPGIAYADLVRGGVPSWMADAVIPGPGELVLVAPHWGPNMRPAPVPHVLAAAAVLEAGGATLVAGHSAHVPHGVRGRVLFDLGDFLDDYAVDPVLRNDLSLLWLVTLDASGPRRVEGVPVVLEYARTRLADAAEARRLAALMAERCAAVGARVELERRRLVFSRDAVSPGPPSA